MILCVSIFILFVYIFIYSLLVNSLIKIKEDSFITNKNLPVSIIIAARNEENNIIPLFNALCCQNYSNELTEIIFVDDSSGDSTLALASQLSENKSNIIVIKAANKKLPGKKGALTEGILQSANPYILITDADCLPEPDWIKAFAQKFSEGYDLLFGVAPFIQRNGLVNKMACFENLRTSILTFGLAGLGLPYSAATRSFGFTKEAFNKIGGYSNTTETLSGDDDLLIREAVKHGLKIGTVNSENSKVFSEAKATFKEYLLQKARHTSTSNYYLPKHKALLGAWHLINIFCLLSPVLSGLSSFFWIPFIVKILSDILIVKKYQIKFGCKFSAGDIILHQIIYEMMLVVNYFLSFTRKDKW